jgi:hypothetical protein
MWDLLLLPHENRAQDVTKTHAFQISEHDISQGQEGPGVSGLTGNDFCENNMKCSARASFKFKVENFSATFVKPGLRGI